MARAPKAPVIELPTKDDVAPEEAVAEADTSKDDSRPDPDKVHGGDQKVRAKKIAFSGYNPGE